MDILKNPERLTHLMGGLLGRELHCLELLLDTLVTLDDRSQELAPSTTLVAGDRAREVHRQLTRVVLLEVTTLGPVETAVVLLGDVQELVLLVAKLLGVLVLCPKLFVLRLVGGALDPALGVDGLTNSHC